MVRTFGIGIFADERLVESTVMLCLVPREGRAATSLFSSSIVSRGIDEIADTGFGKSISTCIVFRHLFNDTTDVVQSCQLLVCFTFVNNGSVKTKSLRTGH